ncbi:hypothetical protein CAOG_06747 [Capsaspora owczarzaki ATCC 30864]|uniref:hypothetical protein n=1 Tax=Capsaspora owczarzaki (strain ATCC 30864) TaxID=595528 RepID=UPI0001FE4138|nr:hypothetical protein CAOG_06747 [Capsaspora owczarzaki ATCC 30864]|eukprot:XP_004344368.1 hypothetical protein CAOG_06747 [Capsaspora owczarzaki ATCC 30864]
MSSQQHPLISAPVAAVPMSSATSAAFGSGSGPVAPPRTGATSPVSASRPNRPQSPPVVVRASSAIPDDDAVPLAESEYNINKITEIQASFVGGQVYGTSLAKGRYAKQVALELDQMTVTAQCHYLPTVYDSENNIDFGKVPLSHVAAVWVPDAKVTTCMVCQNSKFTTFNRKHHCRNCGKVACGNCTSQSWLLPMSSKPQRVCDECVALLKKSSAGASSPAITATPSSAAAPVPAAAAAAPRPQPAPRRPKPPPAVPTASSTANGPSSPSAPANDDDSGSGTDSDDDTSDTDAEDEPQPSARPQSAPRPAAPAPAQRTSRFGDLDQTMKAVVNQQALEAKGAMEKVCLDG